MMFPVLKRMARVYFSLGDVTRCDVRVGKRDVTCHETFHRGPGTLLQAFLRGAPRLPGTFSHSALLILQAVRSDFSIVPKPRQRVQDSDCGTTLRSQVAERCESIRKRSLLPVLGSYLVRLGCFL